MRYVLFISFVFFIFSPSFSNAADNNNYTVFTQPKPKFEEFDTAIKINRDKLLRENNNNNMQYGSGITGIGNIIVHESAHTGPNTNNTEIKNSTIIIMK